MKHLTEKDFLKNFYVKKIKIFIEKKISNMPRPYFFNKIFFYLQILNLFQILRFLVIVLPNRKYDFFMVEIWTTGLFLKMKKGENLKF